MTITRPSRADVGLVGSVTAFACLAVWVEMHYATRPVPWSPGAYLLTLGGATPLLIRKSRPVVAATLCVLCVAGYHFAGYPGLAPAVLIFLATIGLGAYAQRAGLLYGLLASAATWVVLALPPNRLPLFALDVSMPAIAYATGAVVGDSMRRRRVEHETLLRQEAAAAEERVGRMAVEERLRIARDLHDVLAHTISVMAVQSNVALDALDSLGPAGPDAVAARQAIVAARSAARLAMPELRAAVGMLREARATGATESTGDRPQPGIEELSDLAAQVRDSGLEVVLYVDPQAGGLPPLVQLTAYRIVQEALTNTLRHACAGRATVTLKHDRDALSVEITDDGTQAPRGPEGFGLRGMTERAEALAGRLDAGPATTGGFTVRAELPWEMK